MQTCSLSHGTGDWLYLVKTSAFEPDAGNNQAWRRGYTVAREWIGVFEKADEARKLQ